MSHKQSKAIRKSTGISSKSLRASPKLEVVSIHAPAWGATAQYRMCHLPQAVSIHAPAWGATLINSGYFLSNACFNPRSRVGSDINWCLS